ncbi:Hypothetical predicted protein [Octopus vulgaris]|uniref:Uncharacterized protein n=1 Tax=Octopus vulgaris TaxID=6645 RepID=A0AA36EVV3_OCTVU|nr:Hypothetical predicted protein [Octopus vulgaris]
MLKHKDIEEIHKADIINVKCEVEIEELPLDLRENFSLLLDFTVPINFGNIIVANVASTAEIFSVTVHTILVATLVATIVANAYS